DDPRRRSGLAAGRLSASVRGPDQVPTATATVPQLVPFAVQVNFQPALLETCWPLLALPSIACATSSEPLVTQWATGSIVGFAFQPRVAAISTCSPFPSALTASWLRPFPVMLVWVQESWPVQWNWPLPETPCVFAEKVAWMSQRSEPVATEIEP